STIRSTCSASYQRRAMPAPMSGLSWESAEITSIGTPRTLPPKSSTAIWAATSEPVPVASDAGPDMSVRTPILTTLSEIWACAPSKAMADNANATAPRVCARIRSSCVALMAGHSRSKNGVASLAYAPAIHVVATRMEDVDARDKPGHDELRLHPDLAQIDALAERRRDGLPASSRRIDLDRVGAGALVEL